MPTRETKERIMAKKISNAEQVVMEVLWEKSPQSAQEVIDTLAPKKDWNEKTVRTLLNRLLKKEILGFRKESKKYLYFPLISRKAYLQEESQHFLESWFDGKLSPLVFSFAEQELSKSELEELKKLLSKME